MRFSSVSFSLSSLFQKESHAVPGHYCHSKGEYLVSDWYAVHMGSDFTLIFIIPIGLMVHNYVRIARALFESLKENVQLKEGVKSKYVTICTRFWIFFVKKLFFQLTSFKFQY